MPTISQVIDDLQNLTYSKVTQSDIARALGITRATVSARVKTDSQITQNEREKLEKVYNVKLLPQTTGQRLDALMKKLNIADNKEQFFDIIYRPDVCFSAGYGIEVLDESNIETIKLDKKLFITDRGLSINPTMCEVLTVSGNSMSPRWEHGDRFILDKSITHFIDGQIFAFRLNGECYIKEICLLGKRAKAVPLNKDYDPFFIEPDDDLKIFGRVLPRVRL